MATYKFDKSVRENYYGPREFFHEFSDNESCETRLFDLKYPNGFCCPRCKHDQYYKMQSLEIKRARTLQCKKCGKQESLTKNTIFQGTRTPLIKWFQLIFEMTQGKKGISAQQLSKELHLDYSTTLLMMSKIRKEMEESLVNYQIGGSESSVEVDEIDIGGVNSEKQKVLVLLERNPNQKLGRVRMVPIENKEYDTIEKVIVPLVKEGTSIYCDKNPVYTKLKKEYAHKYNIAPLAHWEENHSHEYLKDLNKIVSNLKTWYRGIHHSFRIKNTGLYLNEFCYRFNRRRSEVNIFERLLKRSIKRPNILKNIEFNKEKYDMLRAA